MTPSRNRAFMTLSVILALVGAPNAVHAQPATSAQSDEARERYRRGVELFDDGDYRLALVEFERAHQLSSSYKVLYNIGQVRFHLFQYAKAQVALERYLAEGGDEIPETRRAEVTAELVTLRGRTARLTVEANVPDATIAVDDDAVGNGRVDALLVDAGTRKITASHAGHETRSQTVVLAGGDARTVRIELAANVPQPSSAQPTLAPEKRQDPERGGLPPAALAGWITTGVLASATAVTAVVASNASSDYATLRETPLPPGEGTGRLEEERARVMNLALATDILLIGTVVAGAASLFLTLRGRPTTAATSRLLPHAGGLRVTF